VFCIGQTAAAFIAAVLFSTSALAAGNALPDVASAYIVRIQKETVWSANAQMRLPPASLTKIMTALLVLEDYHPETVVTVSTAAAAATGTRLGIGAGERFAVRDLLTATLVRSANDACFALAQAHAGSEARFVARMNARAVAMGLENTHFTNACGHDAASHYSSAQDLLALADTALLHAEFARLIALPRAAIRARDAAGKSTRTYRFTNNNALIGRFPGAYGVKSGYTARAGKCVIAAAERDGVKVLMVLLNARDRWWDADALLARAFHRAGVEVE